MAQLTYRDFQQRISIQDILEEAGYSRNPKDGRTYPTFSRDKGDKFIVTRNGMACFRPPEQKCYNVISFIKTFPQLFGEYRPGMDRDRLVNLVCNRMLDNPIENARAAEGQRHPDNEREPFDLNDYEVTAFENGDRQSELKFYPYFHNRGISLATARAFSGHFFLASKPSSNGRTYTNLSFPLSTAAWPGKNVLGLEERSKPDTEGRCAYKGLARNSDCTNGIWIASPSFGQLKGASPSFSQLKGGRLSEGSSTHGFDVPFSRVKDIFWFESAYDAMAFYQLHSRESDPSGIDYRNAAYLSTSGSPSMSQFRSVLAQTAEARHHLCFDNDRAGNQFALNFAFTRAGHVFRSGVDGDGNLGINDFTASKGYTVQLDAMPFGETTEALGIYDPRNTRPLPDAPHKDWNEQLMAGMKEQENHKRFHR